MVVVVVVIEIRLDLDARRVVDAREALVLSKPGELVET